MTIRDGRAKNSRLMMVVVGLLATAGMAWAQAPAIGPLGSSSRAELTEDQARQLEALRDRYEDRMLALEQRLTQAEQEYDSTFRRPGMDTDELIALRREVRNLEGELEDLHLRAGAEAARMFGTDGDALSAGSRDRRGLGHGWAWRGSCPWDGCPWDAAWLTDSRATRQTRSSIGGWGPWAARGHCW